MRQGFLTRVRAALEDADLKHALDHNAEFRQRARRAALAGLHDADDLRQQARAIRQLTLDRLDAHLGTFTQRLRERGVQVHRAATAEEACQIVVDLARRRGAAQVAKSKSMLSEEIGLNAALERAGIQPVETDLGEYIVQLRKERPSHILTPALHLSRQAVAETFRSQLGLEVGPEVEELTRAARRSLRRVFLSAPIGVSGVNFGVAETGTLCLVTNEGNGRMVTALPPVHVALMGIERLVPTLSDLRVMLQLLPASATGQKLSSYVTLLNGVRREGDPEGPEERHVVLVDAGRSAMQRGPLAESLLCIRCGACLNACPVFREVGGHAYGSVYPGPIGSVISPGLWGSARYGHLAKASTLCGACVEACPVGIDLPKLLLRVRASHNRVDPQPRWVRRSVRLFTWLAKSETRFGLAQRFAALVSRVLPQSRGWLTALPGPLGAWSGARHFPRFASRPFHRRLGDLRMEGTDWSPEFGPRVETAPFPEAAPTSHKLERFGAELQAVGGEFIRCPEAEAADRVVGQLHVLGATRVLAWGQVEPVLFTVLQRLEQDGFEVIQPHLPTQPFARPQALEEYDRAQAGVTGAQAGFADTGTIALSAGRRRSSLPSLLPGVHLAVLRASDIYESMQAWLDDVGSALTTSTQCMTLITGPSRTADIEMTLTVGVHGPAQLIVICLE
jgi:L-lactate dehydrogenase complex protein LldF